MANSFNFELVSPERLLLSATVSEVVIPGSDGEMTVMAQHAPTMTTIKPGVITVVTSDGKTDRFAVFGGFADILPEGLTVLAESAIRVDDINAAMIKEKIVAAEKALADAVHDGQRQKAREFLDQLTTLEGAILPA